MMSNFKPGAKGLLFLICIFVVSGCVGKKNILFITKTTLGVDVDSKPPTLDIGFDRKEATVAPTGSDGKVLPQLASFKTDDGIVRQSVGQSFATGQAAVIMSKHLGKAHRPSASQADLDADIEGTAEVRGYMDPDERERYFFVTDTSFAFRVNFGLETGGIPDSLSLGYKRKEAALVPVINNAIKDENGDDINVTKNNIRVGNMALASLLSTAGLGTNVSTPSDTSLKYNQFFATGKAAKFLAGQPEIRVATAPLLIPDSQGAIDNLKKNLEIEKKKGALLDNIAEITRFVDPESTSIVNKANLDKAINGLDFTNLTPNSESAFSVQFGNKAITPFQSWLLGNANMTQQIRKKIDAEKKAEAEKVAKKWVAGFIEDAIETEELGVLIRINTFKGLEHILKLGG